MSDVTTLITKKCQNCGLVIEAEIIPEECPRCHGVFCSEQSVTLSVTLPPIVLG